jgi:predicted MPP superfamily phosphohydrolase
MLGWVMMTTITSGTSIAAWTFHIDGFVRIIANAGYIAAIPGWILVYTFGFFGMRDNPLGIIAANAIAWLIWIGLLLVILSIRSRVVKLSLEHPESQAELDSSRRAFLCNAAIGVTGIGAIATPSYATLIEPWGIKVRRYTIPINNLDPAFEGLKLVQLADTHLGPRIPASFVKQAIDLVIKQLPDLVLLTGDHIHDGTNEIDLAAELCKPLVDHASIATVGVLGNHDWWGDGRRMSLALRNQGVRMIDNDRIWIDPKSRTVTDKDPAPGSLAIVGLGDLTDGVIDSNRAFRDVADRTPRVVLSHNPDSAELESLTKRGAPRIDLMCSGHTHGGQVKIPVIGTPFVPSDFGSKYAGGLVDGPAFPVHISRGIGMSMLPVRVGVPPEISVITLTGS